MVRPARARRAIPPPVRVSGQRGLSVMIPGPNTPPAGLPPSPKRLESARNEPPKDTRDSSRFEAEAENILESLAQSARHHPPGQAADAPVDDRASGRRRPALPADESAIALGLAKIDSDRQREAPFSTLNQARQTYDTAQQRQHTVLRQPGSLLDLEA